MISKKLGIFNVIVFGQVYLKKFKQFYKLDQLEPFQTSLDQFKHDLTSLREWVCNYLAFGLKWQLFLGYIIVTNSLDIICKVFNYLSSDIFFCCKNERNFIMKEISFCRMQASDSTLGIENKEAFCYIGSMYIVQWTTQISTDFHFTNFKNWTKL